MTSDAECTLCGLPTPDPPVTDPDVEGAFCCRGCLEVHRTVGDVDPADAADALGAPDSSDVPDDAAVCHLDVRGMHCTTCEAYLEATAADRDSVYAADASYATDALELRYDPERTDENALADAVTGLGYHAAPAGEAGSRDHERDAREFVRMRVFLAAFLGMTTMGMYAVFLYPAYLGYDWSGLLTSPSVAISLFGPLVGATTLELLVVGYPVLRGAYVAVRTHRLNMDVLVAAGALVPYLYSLVAYFVLGTTVVYFDVTTTVITVVTVGNYVEDLVKRRALAGIPTGTATRVTEARRLTADGDIEHVPLDDCGPDDRLRVEGDERVPADGTVVGDSVVGDSVVVDESLLTGESRPRTRRPGDPVVGGSRVVDGPLVVALDDGTESTLDRIVDAMRHVRSTHAGVQRLADSLAAVFVPLVVGFAVLTALVWVGGGASIQTAILTGVAVLAVSCPCSLGLATPIALVAGVRAAAERDVAVLNTTVFEGVADAAVVAFDKTGTLTTGEMRVERVVASDADEDAVVARAAAAEADADHPVAAAVRARATDPVLDAEEIRVEGRSRGVSAVVEGERVTVGHPDLFADAEWPADCEAAVGVARDAGELPVAVAWGGRVRGVFTVDDTPRDGWEPTLSALRDAGHRVVVVTGDDSSRTGRYEASDAVDEVFADVPPEAKAAVVDRLRTNGPTVMVGDGTNDAPALAAADLGVAFASGTDVALEAADATVLAGGLDAVGDVFGVGRETRRRVRQNLAWAFAYNAVALPLAALGLVDPLVASAAMAVSSLLVVSNAARSYGDATTHRSDGVDARQSSHDPSAGRTAAGAD